MLTIPKFGWTNVVIEDFKEPASYLTDVPMECLDSMIFALSNNASFCVDFDAEGYTYKVISDWYKTFIIMEQDSPTLIVFENKSRNDLAKELLEDISTNIDDWCNFSYSIEEDGEEEFNRYKKELNKKIEILKSLIDKS